MAFEKEMQEFAIRQEHARNAEKYHFIYGREIVNCSKQHKNKPLTLLL